MGYITLKKFLSGEHAKAFLIIFLALALAYAVPLLMHRSQNPIYQRSGVAAQIHPGYVSGQNTIDPNDGFTSQALGHTAAKSWLSGDVPYWNHYEGLGTPLAGETQSAAMFPLTLLQYFGNGLVYFHFVLQLIAGMATYLFFRKLKVKFAVAVLGGVLFALGGAFAWLTNAPFNAVAFLPLLLLGIEQAISQAEKSKRGGWLLLAIALTMSLYAGFPEGAYISAIFAYGWGAVRLLYMKKKARKPYIYKVIFGSIIGLLLAGPMLIALAGYLPYGVTGGHEGGGYGNLSLPFSTLPALFMPYIFGPIFGFVAAGKPADIFMFWSNVGGYLTMPLLLFGLFGLYAKRPLGLKLYPAIFAAVVVLKIYGFKPAELLVNAIPGMSQVAFYRYCIPALCFAAIMLAVFGVEAVIKQQIAKKKTLILTALTLLLTLVLALFARRLLHQLLAFPSHRWWAIFSVLWALSILVVPILMILRTKLKFIGIALLLVIDAFAMFIVPLFSLPKMSPIDQKPVTYLQENLGLNRFYTLHPIGPNYGSYYKIASINVNDLPIPKDFANYVPKLDKNVNPLVFTGYSRTDPAGPSALEEFGRNIDEFENASVKYLVADPRQVTPDFAAQHGLKLVFSDQLAEIFALPEPKLYFESAPACALTYQSRDQVVVDCRSKATLVRREQYMPGWAASVNGLNRQVKPDQEVFQKVDVPAGKSVVKFIYNPPFIGLGYVALALGIVMIAAGYFLRTVKLK
jgi:hypothetical protein